MSINTLSTANTFQEWLVVTNQLTAQQDFFESSIATLQIGSEKANTVVVKSSTDNTAFYLLSANSVSSGNATNVFSHSSIYYNPSSGILYLPSTEYSGTEKIVLPRGNTSQRLVANVSGSLRYNTETEKFEGYANGWDTVVLTNDIINLKNELYDDVGLANTANLTYSIDGRVIAITEQLLSGATQNTEYTYDINNERIVTEVVTIGSVTKTTTYNYDSSNTLISWITVES